MVSSPGDRPRLRLLCGGFDACRDFAARNGLANKDWKHIAPGTDGIRGFEGVLRNPDSRTDLVIVGGREPCHWPTERDHEMFRVLGFRE